MNDSWMNVALEIGVIALLGMLYYFYQKRKILKHEDSKPTFVMNYILQACLSEKKDSPQPELDQVIESLDDYLTGKSTQPPLAMLQTYAHSVDCSMELKNLILEGIKEIE